MNKNALKAAGVIVLLVTLSVVCLAWVSPGRMTGGGSLFTTGGTEPASTQIDTGGIRVTNGLELHCGSDSNPAGPGPNTFEINWLGNHFHLQTLTMAMCLYDPSINPKPPAAGFDAFIGTGTGSFDNGPDNGACIAFELTDAGEPGGGGDTGTITITSPCGGSVVLNVPTTTLHNGNYQAHKGN